MLLNDLLAKEGIEPGGVLVFRHTPEERELRRVLPWLAAERPEVFNAYQQTHGQQVETALLRARYVVSFIGHETGRAIFIGLYKVGDHRALTHEQYWGISAYKEMKNFGMKGFEGDRPSVLWFDLEFTNFYKAWQGKLVVDWPRPAIRWYRWAIQAQFPIHAILEDSILTGALPDWRDIFLTWAELRILPAQWREAMRHWRGIYFINDHSDGKGYVGSAYGQHNLLGRWEQYEAGGHGGNVHLLERRPENFRFSILERVSPDLEADEVVRLEATWKKRLCTRWPEGLNDN
jgi:hypothetical protein